MLMVLSGGGMGEPESCKPQNLLNSWCFLSKHVLNIFGMFDWLINFFFLFQRCVYHLLVTFLPYPCAEGSLQKLLHLAFPVQHCHLARISEQRCQSCHIHHFQHRVSQSLHQNPALLSGGEKRIVKKINPSRGASQTYEWYVLENGRGKSKYR